MSTIIRLWLVRIIMATTSFIICMPILNPFWESIGMTQTQIGVSQFVFTIVMIGCNIAAGRWADRHGRKQAALIGLAITAVSFVLYAFASNVAWVIVWEITTGIGMAFVSGADTGLHRVYCEELHKNITRDRTLITIGGSLVGAAAMMLGGYLGDQSYRLAMLVTAVPFVLAGLLALCLREVIEPAKEYTPLKDVLRDIAADRRLRWRIMANLTSREITHSQIWVFTPLMLSAGIEPKLIGGGWALQFIAQIPGGILARQLNRGWLAQKLGWSMSPWVAYTAGMTATLTACFWLSLQVTTASILIGFAVFGMMRSWSSSLIAPLVTTAAHPDHVTTTESVSDTASRLIYAPMVLLVTSVSDIKTQYALTLTFAVFLIPAIITAGKFRASELSANQTTPTS